MLREIVLGTCSGLIGPQTDAKCLVCVDVMKKLPMGQRTWVVRQLTHASFQSLMEKIDNREMMS